jgi:Bacterial Ig-like domain (group 3)/Beta-propeller repeat
MSIPRWINSLRATVFGGPACGQKRMPNRNRSRLSLERLEDRLSPAGGLASSNQQLLSAYGQLPLSFEANQGQTAAQVQFFTHTGGGTLFLTSNSAVLSLTTPDNSWRQDSDLADPANGKISIAQPQNTGTTGVALALNLVGANPNASVFGLDKLPGISNYFIGNDPSQWHTNIPNYSKVEYQNVYPGINLVYYGNQQQLEYDYQLAPGADPSSIRFVVQGADGLSIDDKGNLVLHAATGDVLEHAPVIYQQVDGIQQSVSGRFVLLGNNEVGFQVGSYDATLPLVIDPVLSYSTYLGGSGIDAGQGIAVDGSGNAYVTGVTNSTNFPTTSGVQTTLGSTNGNAFVTELNASGTAVLYSTYIGGTGTAQGEAIAVDGSGNAYITGGSYDANFPTTAGAFQPSFGGGSTDAFVTQLNSTGTTLVYSTYLGGSGNDLGSGIALDTSGNAFVTGFAASTNFPTTTNAFETSLDGGSGTIDAFVAKVNATGTALVYSTYLGGSDNGSTQGQAIAVDGLGNAYVTGYTGSASFPTTTGAIQTDLQTSSNGTGDAFVTELNTSGTALVYSTFLGVGASGRGIAVDASGDAFITGGYFESLPTTPGAFQSTGLGGNTWHAFVAEVNGSGTDLVYCAELGGGGQDFGYSIAIDDFGDAYITGSTYSTNFPTTSDAFQNSLSGNNNAFVTELNVGGTGLIYSTYLGNSNSAANGIALDGLGNAYITGFSSSANFPTTSGAFQTSFGGNYDAFVAEFNFGMLTTTTLTDNGPNPSNYGDAVSFTATVNGGSAIDGETVFIEDATNSFVVVASPTLTNGTVNFTISDLPAGSHHLIAVYNGDTTHASSNDSGSSTPVIQVVNPVGAAPTFESIEVNGGTVQYHDAFGNGSAEPIAGQNSVVEQILVTFNEPVTLNPGAFSVTPYSINNGVDPLAPGEVLVNSGPNPNQVAPILNAPIQVGDGHQWIITFGNNAATTDNGQGFYVLKDGVYSLNIDHTKVTANAQNMAADVTGPGASSFWALYGDTTFHDISGVDHPGYIGDTYSDASVGNADFQAFKACDNSDSTNYYAPPNYDVRFDANLDGSVANSDFVQFKTNYNTDWQF